MKQAETLQPNKFDFDEFSVKLIQNSVLFIIAFLLLFLLYVMINK